MSVVAQNPPQGEEKVKYGLKDLFNAPRMTKEYLLKHCKELKLYRTPHLNDVLYLHFKGFSYIENLEEYTNLKCLWLENNGLREISGLDHQTELRSLFLHYNLIKKIENLQNCPLLDNLNLAHNQVKKIENLDSIKQLHTLNLSHNYVETIDDLKHLAELLELSVLDLSNNHIDDPLVVEVLGKMPELRVLSLMGNPAIRKIPAYRKTMILACKNLQYLDDRPVFPRDRACAEAWERGGVAEENAERQRWIEREHRRIMESVDAVIAMRDRRRAEMAQQVTRSDSGVGTSVADSESESKGGESTSSDEEDEGEEEESGNNFMRDRQTTEDYSEYRERIFDFSPRRPSEGRLLVEEIKEETSEECAAAELENKESVDKKGHHTLDAEKLRELLTEEIKKEKEDDQNMEECFGDMMKVEHIEGKNEDNKPEAGNNCEIKIRNEATDDHIYEEFIEDGCLQSLFAMDQTNGEDNLTKVEERAKEPEDYDKKLDQNEDQKIFKTEEAQITDETLGRKLVEAVDKIAEEINESDKENYGRSLVNAINKMYSNEETNTEENSNQIEDKSSVAPTENPQTEPPPIQNKEKDPIEDMGRKLLAAIDKMTFELKKREEIEAAKKINAKKFTSVGVCTEETQTQTEEKEKRYYEELDVSKNTDYDHLLEHNDGHKILENLNDRFIRKRDVPLPPYVEEIDAANPGQEYREILTWNLKVKEDNTKIALPIMRRRIEVDEDDELYELIEAMKKDEEFSVVPPGDIAEENDVILYPRRRRGFGRFEGEDNDCGNVAKSLANLRKEMATFCESIEEFIKSTKFNERKKNDGKGEKEDIDAENKKKDGSGDYESKDIHELDKNTVAVCEEIKDIEEQNTISDPDKIEDTDDIHENEEKDKNEDECKQEEKDHGDDAILHVVKREVTCTLEMQLANDL
ncbi:hypothetical protein Zmor_017005 [Zophobas morio]|uniref:Dynein axonemal assembly factor 1 homolog n=1 Tax=Zophobas morio TaxID=2755281 RepID=A0AA38MBG8_9CUCU|nr:hypothetical protein Zmor_017005 [Zophobas morio]